MGQVQTKAHLSFLWGLDKAGKTKYMYSNLVDIQNEDLKSSFGFNWERLLGTVSKFSVYEGGGNKYLRQFWQIMVECINFTSIIFVVNTFQPHRIEEARLALHEVVNSPYVKEIILCIILNTPYLK